MGVVRRRIRLRVIRRRGGNVLDLRKSYKVSLADLIMSQRAMPSRRWAPWGYNDAAAVSLATASMLR